MKKFLFVFLMMLGCMEANAIDLGGKYVSQSGELLFRFEGDSLYIEIAQSHRSVSAFKLVKTKENKNTTTFDAFESYLENGKMTYRQVMIRVTRQSSKKFLLEYFGKDKDREYNSNERYTIKPLK